MSPAAARSLLAALALLAPAGPARADTVSCYLRGGVAKDVSGCSRGGAWRTFVLTGSRTAATWTGHHQYRILLTLMGGAKVIVAKCYYWVFAAFFSPPPPTKRLMGLDGIM